jgi:hypothetical protein
MVHNLVIADARQKDAIFSGEKTAQVFLKNLCRAEFRVGDKIIFCHPGLDDPVAVAEVLEVQASEFIQVSMDAWVMAGFRWFEQAYHYFYDTYPNLHAHEAMVFVRWGAIQRLEEAPAPAHCEECDDRDQT